MTVLDTLIGITPEQFGLPSISSGASSAAAGAVKSATKAATEATKTGAGLLKTLSTVGDVASGIGSVGSFVTGLVGGILNAGEAEKAQEYQRKWAELLRSDELKQQAIQNKQTQEQIDLSKAGQYFNNELALRNEARTNTANWHTYMQNSANKYADVLNRSRALRKSNAEALRNR